MRIDFSNKRYSIILTGILVAFAASIIIVIVLGIGCSELHSLYEVESVYRGLPLDGSTDTTPESIPLKKCSSEYKVVPGAEMAFDLCHDVQKGWMEVVYNIPHEFPICITDDYLNQNFVLTVTSYGGYSPDLLSNNYMTLYQPKADKGGIIEIIWEEVEDVPSCCPTTEYIATYDIIGEDFILLDSNYLPDVYTQGADFPFLLESEPTENLGKWVYVGVFSSWEGCPDPNQKFKLILAH